jgi:hypothetical protein
MDIMVPSHSQSKTTNLQFLLKYTHPHVVSTLAFSTPISAYVYFTKLYSTTVITLVSPIIMVTISTMIAIINVPWLLHT